MWCTMSAYWALVFQIYKTQCLFICVYSEFVRKIYKYNIYIYSEYTVYDIYTYYWELYEIRMACFNFHSREEF